MLACAALCLLAWLARARTHRIEATSAPAREEVRGTIAVAPPGTPLEREPVAPLEVGEPAPIHSEPILAPPARGSIRGVVVNADGNPVPTHPAVLAFPAGHPPRKRAVFEALNGWNDSVLLTRADERGEFTLSDLEPGGSYELLVGGGGVALTTPVTAPPDSRVVLRVTPVFGARIGILGWPASRSALWQPPGPEWTWDPAAVAASGVPTDSLTAVLVGLEPSETLRAPSNPMPMLFLAESEAEAVGPIHLRGTPAGYAPLDERVSIPRLTEAIQEVWIEARPRAAGWGSLRVERRMPLTLTSGVERQGRIGKVWFVAAEATFEYAFLDWSSEPLHIGSVPFGTYSIALSTESGYVHYPAREAFVDLRPGVEEARVSFDLRSSCEVEFSVRRRGGVDLEGECAIEVSQELEGDVFSSCATFARPPYVVQGLVPGRYGFTLKSPFYEPAPIWLDLPLAKGAPAPVFIER